MSENPLAIAFKGSGVNREKILEQEVKRILTLELHCDVEKLHGTEFQTGLPDLLVLHNARVLLIELKWSNKRPNSVGEIFGMLRGRQKSLIPLWGGKGAPVWVLCGFKKNGEFYACATKGGNREWTRIPSEHALRESLQLLLMHDRDI